MTMDQLCLPGGRWLGRLPLAALLVLLAGYGSAGAELRSSHGDWQIRCETPPGARSEQCVLRQFVTADDRPEVGLVVNAFKLADGQGSLLSVTAPLGVLLPTGLGLYIDGDEIGRVDFMRCLPSGCIADADLDGELVSRLSEGEEALFVIFQTPEEGIGIPISLAGFGDGYAALP